MLAFIGGLGPTEIVVIMVVMALIFGASRIPEIGANLGKGIKNFKKSVTEIDDDSAEPKELEEESKQS